MKLWLILIDTGGHPNMPRTTLKYHSWYEDEIDAESTADRLNRQFEEEDRRQMHQHAMLAHYPRQVAHVVEADMTGL